MREKNKINVPGLARGVDIINLIAENPHPLLATDISKMLSLPKSSVHGLLQTLLYTGLLKKDLEQKYYLGTKIISWANSFMDKNNLISVFLSEVNKIKELDGYTITLTNLDKNDVIYLACKEANNSLGFSFKIGMRLPAVFTATGKIMISSFSDDEINSIFNQNWPKKLTKNSIKNFDELKQEIDIIRKNGYSIDNGQIKDAMYCLGTLIYDEHHKTRAGIAVSLIKEEFSIEIQNELLKQLNILVNNIKNKLGVN